MVGVSRFGVCRFGCGVSRFGVSSAGFRCSGARFPDMGFRVRLFVVRSSRFGVFTVSRLGFQVRGFHGGGSPIGVTGT